MFSLIITIISIALVAALALATLYYGGDAFKRGAASADATKLQVQAQQLQGAAELYKADTGAYPLTMEAMLSGNYLKSIPVSSLGPVQAPGYAPALMAQASAAGVAWKMVLAGYPVFAVEAVTPEVCEAVNLKAYGVSGILKSARSNYTTQCFGPDIGHLTMVTTKSGAMLITASTSPLATVALGDVLTTTPPAVESGDMTDAGWLVVEGVTVALDGGSGGTDPVDPGPFTYSLTNVTTGDVFANARGVVGLAGAQVVELLVTNTSAIAGGVTLDWYWNENLFTAWPSPFAAATTCGSVMAPGGTCTVTLTGLSSPDAIDTYMTMAPFAAAASVPGANWAAGNASWITAGNPYANVRYDSSGSGSGTGTNATLQLTRGVDNSVSYVVAILEDGSVPNASWSSTGNFVVTGSSSTAGNVHCGDYTEVSPSGEWNVTCTVSAEATLGAGTLTLNSYYFSPSTSIVIPINIVP